jgi:hypothetical protein
LIFIALTPAIKKIIYLIIVINIKTGNNLDRIEFDDVLANIGPRVLERPCL